MRRVVVSTSPSSKWLTTPAMLVAFERAFFTDNDDPVINFDIPSANEAIVGPMAIIAGSVGINPNLMS